MHLQELQETSLRSMPATAVPGAHPDPQGRQPAAPERPSHGQHMPAHALVPPGSRHEPPVGQHCAGQHLAQVPPQGAWVPWVTIQELQHTQTVPEGDEPAADMPQAQRPRAPETAWAEQEFPQGWQLSPPSADSDQSLSDAADRGQRQAPPGAALLPCLVGRSGSSADACSTSTAVVGLHAPSRERPVMPAAHAQPAARCAAAEQQARSSVPCCALPRQAGGTSGLPELGQPASVSQEPQQAAHSAQGDEASAIVDGQGKQGLSQPDVAPPGDKQLHSASVDQAAPCGQAQQCTQACLLKLLTPDILVTFFCLLKEFTAVVWHLL